MPCTKYFCAMQYRTNNGIMDKKAPAKEGHTSVSPSHTNKAIPAGRVRILVELVIIIG